MGICTAQSSDVMHHFQQSFTTDFMLVTVSSRSTGKTRMNNAEIVNLLMQHADLEKLRDCNSAYSLRNDIMNKDETLKNIAWDTNRWEDPEVNTRYKTSDNETEGIKSLLSKALDKKGILKKEEGVSKKKKVVQVDRDLINSDPNALSNIESPGPNDVMTGRGRGINDHPGNIKFRRIVEDSKPTYKATTSKAEKTTIAINIVTKWRALDPPGRFLKKNEKTGLWDDTGDKEAHKKTSQALREGVLQRVNEIEVKDTVRESKKRKAVEVEPITLQDENIDPSHHTAILLKDFKWDDDGEQKGSGIVDESAVVYTSSDRVFIVEDQQASYQASIQMQQPPPQQNCPPLLQQPMICQPAPEGEQAVQRKRSRRKCTVPNCTNKVVQGGLCISHGAKRKICSHPGCTKNVKKLGLCSAHGPARKKCEFEGCVKVAVQGGRCIAHGAKKKPRNKK